MKVREAMTGRAVTIGPDETLRVAARRMRELGVGALPVTEDERLIGIVTDRDLVVRAMAEGADPDRGTVRSAMTPQLICCTEEDELGDAARMMEERAVRRVMVVDERERLVGMLSVDDLALASQPLAAEVIARSREPERGPRSSAP